MEISFSIEYHELVIREDIPKIAPGWRAKIKSAVEEKLTVAPEQFGKPLRRSLRGYRKLRVGAYRVIFRITGNKVLVFAIQHRAVVYHNAGKRLR
jgi:mRNA interferase RelE/StbE